MPRVAGGIDEALKIADGIGYPVALKIHSPDISHKSDVGGVILNVIDENSLKDSFNKIIDSVEEKKPDAKIEGISLQKMVCTDNKLELIMGIKKDQVFGTVIMVGMGGTEAELFHDRTIGFPPLNEALARQMIESLKIYPLIKGYRGSKPMNMDKLIGMLIRMSYIAADFPEIKELDINPLLLTEDD